VNGSPFPAPSALQTSRSPRTLPGRSSGRGAGRNLLIAFVVLLLLVGADVAAHFATGKSLLIGYLLNPDGGVRADVILHTVKREPLDVTVTEKGQLESADNKDLVCKVRAGTRGTATTITWVIDDGSRIRPGQLLMILDDSFLKEQEDTQSIVVKEKQAAKVKADKDYEIQLKMNETLVKSAQADLTIKEIQLDKLTGLSPDPMLKGLAAVAGILSSLTENGSYQQSLDDLNGQISLERSNVEQNRERANWADRMVKLTYMSPAQAQAERSRLESSIENLRKLETQRDLLISHDRREQLTTLTNARDTAQRTLEQEILRSDATKAQFYIAMETATDVYEKEQAKLEDIQRQREECKIFAPDDIEDGSMVVYFKNESRRFSNSSEGMIEQGAQVKEGQKMLRIPNLSRMQVNTKIHEAMVGRVKGDDRVPTKLVDFMQFGMLTNPDLMGRAVAARPDLIERVRERFRKIDPQFEYKKIADGQGARIRVESVLNKEFVGHVRSVAAIASQADSWISDTKLFQTYVLIEGEKGPNGTILPLKRESLRPDMTAEVTIHVDGTPGPVLTMPIQSVIGGAEKGATRDVYVKTAEGYERRTVTLGLYNERMVEIIEGIAEGEEVVVNPKVLMGESKEKTREPGDLKGAKEPRQKNGYKQEGGPPGGFPSGSGSDPSKGGGKGGFPGGGGKFKGGKGGGQPPIIS
jgi:hypothetical protein